MTRCPYSFFFFFNDTATTEIYTLSLHDALPIYVSGQEARSRMTNAMSPDEIGPHLREVALRCQSLARESTDLRASRDRKSTRLNSSHQIISYAVFCLKKKQACLHVLNTRVLDGR